MLERHISVALLCAIALAASVSSCADVNTRQTEHPLASTLEQKGKQLRAEIDATYRNLKSSKALAHGPRSSNDVSAIVLEYIPAGISFDDAEVILRSAGCRLSPRPTEGGYVFASTNIGAGLSDIMGHALTVNLVPRTPGDFSVIGTLSASIIPLYS